ncbi:motile sperm domain-containing protein 1-like [Xenia sp. Carnegie-2017]|uniref:motile sperm domain-containing protein 1-like n=1 Tax=Xenia sp. Carnegie-2017 TaxID=2897299 RepID=UPI001F035ECC|nr:motile sperm domain-containing protein 1-like [Xenia sp. Carnegie-2017]XP_046852938.1 motile sperm domain-containing protein 1-like [Xenia sp. Carnegie-2017]
MKSSHLKDGRLPVFVFPESLTFFADDQSTFKEVLTVYNPYTFSVEYKVFGTAPRLYKVTEAQGVIKPHCCVDIVIRCLEIKNHTERTDKFRLCLFEHGIQKRIGEKVIAASVVNKKENIDKKKFPANSAKKSLRSHQDFKVHSEVRSGPSALIIILCAICLIALVLPTVGEISSMPFYLHLTINQKLIAAYILGLATMAILKAN